MKNIILASVLTLSINLVFSQERLSAIGTYSNTHAVQGTFKTLGFFNYTDNKKKTQAIYVSFDKEQGDAYKIDNGEKLTLSGNVIKSTFDDGKEYAVLMVEKTVFDTPKERKIILPEESKQFPIVRSSLGGNTVKLTYKTVALLDRRKISDVIKEKENNSKNDNIKPVIESNILVTNVGVTTISKQQAQEALDVHNNERKSLGIPPLKWSVKLSQVAQGWANELVKSGCGLEHSSIGYGENLFGGWGAVYTAKDASIAWLDEKSEFSKYGWWPEAGHYSQMIWSSTQEIGMAVGTCPDGSMVIVAEYSEAGNYEGESPY